MHVEVEERVEPSDAGQSVGRVVAAFVLIVIAAVIVQMTLGRVSNEYARVAPALDEIRAQNGGDLSCDEWYQLEINSRFMDQDALGGIDPDLVRFAVDDGDDVYLWAIVATPLLLVALLCLLIAFAQPETRFWRIVIRAAVVGVVLFAVVSFPSDTATGSALSCLYE